MTWFIDDLRAPISTGTRSTPTADPGTSSAAPSREAACRDLRMPVGVLTKPTSPWEENKYHGIPFDLSFQ